MFLFQEWKPKHADDPEVWVYLPVLNVLLVDMLNSLKQNSEAHNFFLTLKCWNEILS